MVKLSDRELLEKSDYKTLLIMCNLNGILQLKQMAIRDQNYEDAARYRDWEKFIETDECKKLLERKKSEYRQKKLERIMKKPNLFS